MSTDDFKAAVLSGFNLNTVVLIVGLFFTAGVTWSKLNSAIEDGREAVTQASATAHAEVEAVRTDLARGQAESQKWIDAHEATGRDRLAANTSAQARLDAEVEAVRKDVATSDRKIDQHEYRLTSAEAQISQVRQTLEKITEKIDAIDRNVLLLAQRAGVQTDDVGPKATQGNRR